MRAYSSMSTTDFVAQIRDIAIKAGARALVIAQIDAIVDGLTEDEIEELCEEARDEGDSEGRGKQWEMCYDALCAGLEDIVGMGADREAILQLLIEIKPEWLK